MSLTAGSLLSVPERVPLDRVLVLGMHGYGKNTATYDMHGILVSCVLSGVWPLSVVDKRCPECGIGLRGKVCIMPCTCVYHEECSARGKARRKCCACRQSTQQWKF